MKMKNTTQKIGEGNNSYPAHSKNELKPTPPEWG